MVRHSSIGVLLACVVQFDMFPEELDVKIAFLHGNLEETIFMSQPEGYIKQGDEKKVCLLKKSLYGLKQSPRQWYLHFDEFMIKNGYLISAYNNCVYYKWLSVGIGIFLLLYVNDMLIASVDRTKISKLKEQLGSEFEMKGLGRARKILGMSIERNAVKGELRIENFTKEIFATSLSQIWNEGVKNCYDSHSPAFQTFSYAEEIQYMCIVPCSNVVGCLMYSMVCTRPNLAFAVSLISRFIANPVKYIGKLSNGC